MSAGNMTAQYLSAQAGQQQHMMDSLFTAFAGFTAFGAAIVAVLASGGTLQNLADLWTDRARKEHPGKRLAWLWCLKLIVIVPPALVIILVVLGSGAGMLLSFFWLRADGSGGWGWACSASVVLFVCAVAGVTVATLLAVGAAVAASAKAPGQAAGEARRDRAARHHPGHAVMPAHARMDLSRGRRRGHDLGRPVLRGNRRDQQWRQPERYPS
jgi:hypothetical protein